MSRVLVDIFFAAVVVSSKCKLVIGHGCNICRVSDFSPEYLADEVRKMRAHIEHLEYELRACSENQSFFTKLVSSLSTPAEFRRKFSEGSASQLGQDLVALAASGFRRDGYFVEVGACDGYSLSNTLWLEREFEWKGILVEPSRAWSSELLASRAAVVDRRLVSNKRKRVRFRETLDPHFSGTMSRPISRKAIPQIRSYKVLGVTLDEVLKKYGAPSEIDFLSIDTEGSEIEVLQGLDFRNYSFNFICVEHNWDARQEKTFRILRQNGYQRVMVSFSRWDSWWVPEHSKLLAALTD